MRRILSVATVTMVAMMALCIASVAAAQTTKTVKGTVMKTGPDSMTVKVAEKEMTFKVDGETKLVAKGGATAMREARGQGKASLPYTDIVKVGQTVEVDYHESQMHAAEVRVTGAAPAAKAADPNAAPPPPPPPTVKTATGVVTAVSDSSMTVKGSGGEVMFVIYGKTKVFGTGLGTKSRELQGAGQKTVFTEFVHKGDTVRVSYMEESGTRTASEVRVTRKGTI